MEVNRESLAALGRAHVAFGEQFAWFVLESIERAHRLNMDAFETFWARRIGEAKAAAELAAPATRHDALAAALLEQWTRASEAVAYLSHEFGRLVTEYVDKLKNAAPADPDASPRAAANRGRGAKVPRSASAAVATAG